MDKIRFYRVNLGYIKYLWDTDKKVQYNISQPSEYNERRPYLGIAIKINKYNYFAPLEHPRPNHKNLKSNVHIFKIKNGDYGLVAFNNMIPIDKNQLINFDFKNENVIYREILENQFRYCDDNKEKIFQQAVNTYDKVVNKKQEFFIKVCCDFKKLEDLCENYIKTEQEVAATKQEIT
jgi:protein AbiQ